jgi:hypothetical protein
MSPVALMALTSMAGMLPNSPIDNGHLLGQTRYAGTTVHKPWPGGRVYPNALAIISPVFLLD